MRKITQSIILATGIAALFARVKLEANYQDMYLRFPALPRKKVRKAYRTFLLAAYRGALSDKINDDTSDAEMDKLFMMYYNAIK